MMDLNFSEKLLRDLYHTKINFNEEDIVVNAGQHEDNAVLSDDLIKHWLNFAVYYEKSAAIFIGQWLKSTKEDDALVHFAHQIEDETNHYRWLKKHLQAYVKNTEDFIPPPEWHFLMDEYYPCLPSLIERLAAHNLAAETGALGFAEFYFNRFPLEIQLTLKKVIKDERYHISFGKRLLNKYCKTKEEEELASQTAFEALEHMKKAREVFVRT